MPCPYAELVILDGLKHANLVEGPESVAYQVRDFLLRHTGTRPDARMSMAEQKGTTSAV